MSGTDVLTVTQAAERLGVHRTTLLHQIRNGALNAKKLGHQWIITAAEIERYRHAHLGRQGFASPDHPLHGRRSRDGRPGRA